MNHHAEPHPLAGRTVTVNPAARLTGHASGAPVQFEIDDWNDRTFGQSWMVMDGHPASLNYAMRSADGGLPIDNEVVYGRETESGRGHLVHISEIEAGEQR